MKTRIIINFKSWSSNIFILFNFKILDRNVKYNNNYIKNNKIERKIYNEYI